MKKEIVGTVIEAKFASLYACIFMDKVEREFLEAEDIKQCVWLGYIDNIFFIWIEGKNKFENFLQCSNTLHSNLKFIQKKSKTSVNSIILFCSELTVVNLRQIFKVSPLIIISFLDLTRSISYISKFTCYSQGLHIKRLCSSSMAFEKDFGSIPSCLKKRGYPQETC